MITGFSRTEWKSWTMNWRYEEFSSGGSGLKGLVSRVWGEGWGGGQSSVDGRSFQSNQGSVDSEAQNCHYSRAQSHPQPEGRAAQV